MKRLTIPVRSTFVAALVTALALIGLVYAALLSNPSIVRGSTITTASAYLRVSTDGQHFNEQVSGFDFTNIMPGSNLQPVPGKNLSLRNDGTSRLELRIKADPLQATNIDLARVYIAFTRSDSGSAQQYALSALTSGRLTKLGIILNPGQRIDYTLQARVEEGAIPNTTQPVVLSGINLVFDGSTENT